MWGGSIKIGARHFWSRGVFVLVISNINIGFQKLLTLPLSKLIVRIGPYTKVLPYVFVFETIHLFG